MRANTETGETANNKYNQLNKQREQEQEQAKLMWGDSECLKVINDEIDLISAAKIQSDGVMNIKDLFHF